MNCYFKKMLVATLVIAFLFVLVSCNGAGEEPDVKNNTQSLRQLLQQNPESAIEKVNACKFSFPDVLDCANMLEKKSNWENLNPTVQLALLKVKRLNLPLGHKMKSPALTPENKALYRKISDTASKITAEDNLAFDKWVIASTTLSDLEKHNVRTFVLLACNNILKNNSSQNMGGKIMVFLCDERIQGAALYIGSVFFASSETYETIRYFVDQMNEQNAESITDVYLKFMFCTGTTGIIKIIDIPISDRLAYCKGWLDDNSQYVFFANISAQQASVAMPFEVIYPAKYLGVQVSINSGESIDRLDSFQSKRWKEIEQLDTRQQYILSKYSKSLRDKDKSQWNDWIKLSVKEQLASIPVEQKN